MKDIKTHSPQQNMDKDFSRKIGSTPFKVDKSAMKIAPLMVSPSALPRPRPDKNKVVSVFEAEAHHRKK